MQCVVEAWCVADCCCSVVLLQCVAAVYCVAVVAVVSRHSLSMQCDPTAGVVPVR